jgi:hypothetical protein
MHADHRLRVVSLIEGLPTEPPDGLPLPKMVIVPPESGYPGFGELIRLGTKDHTEVCKPGCK